MERYRPHPKAAVYYLTYTVVEWLSLFVSEAIRKLVTDGLTSCHREELLLNNSSAARKGGNFP